MKKILIVLRLIILMIVSACDLNENHFVGTWQYSEYSEEWNPYPPPEFLSGTTVYTVIFSEDMHLTFLMELYIGGVWDGGLGMSGTYDYTDTELMVTCSGMPDVIMTYSFSADYESLTIYEDGIPMTFARQ